MCQHPKGEIKPLTTAWCDAKFDSDQDKDEKNVNIHVSFVSSLFCGNRMTMQKNTNFVVTNSQQNLLRQANLRKMQNLDLTAMRNLNLMKNLLGIHIRVCTLNEDECVRRIEPW